MKPVGPCFPVKLVATVRNWWISRGTRAQIGPRLTAIGQSVQLKLYNLDYDNNKKPSCRPGIARTAHQRHITLRVRKRIIYGQFRRSLKTFLFWVVSPRRSATCVNCTLETLLLTYLLTYLFLVRQYKMHHFEIFAFKKYGDLETWVRVQSRSLEMALFVRSRMISY